MPQFLSAKPEYQYSVIAGFKKIWDAPVAQQTEVPWDNIWPKLIDFFEALLTNEEFWEEDVFDQSDLSPTRNWIPPLIADFLVAGTRSDERAYAPELMPRSLSIIVILLRRVEPEAEPHNGDMLNVAINTAKGKAIEALFNHALRRCRLDEKAKNAHAEAWEELQPLFDAELGQCRDGNFEFSALAGAYIANLHFMSAVWVQNKFEEIFPTRFPRNCIAALDGHAFAPSIKPVFDELIARGVVDWALRRDTIRDYTREKSFAAVGPVLPLG